MNELLIITLFNAVFFALFFNTSNNKLFISIEIFICLQVFKLFHIDIKIKHETIIYIKNNVYIHFVRL